MFFGSEEAIPFDPSESTTVSDHLPLKEHHATAILNPYGSDRGIVFDPSTGRSASVEGNEEDFRVEKLNNRLKIRCSKVQLGVLTMTLLCLAILVTTVASVLFCKENTQSNELHASKQILANFTATSPLMSFDYEKFLVILSEQKRPNKMLVERLALNNTNAAFRQSVTSLPKGMRRCRQLSDEVFCCFADLLSKIGTHCYIVEGNITRHLYERWMAPSNFWQTLQLDGTMVGLQRNRDYRILHTRRGVVYPVSYDEKPMDLTSASYFFPMENIFELAELAIRDDKVFFICEYVKLSSQHFRLVGDKDDKCRQTRLKRHGGMRGVRFCANPIYQAIIQFDAVRPREHRHMRWQLQMSYKEDDESVFQLDAEDISPSGQIAVECNPEEINVYITSEKHLLKYAVDLPRSGLESLLGNFF